MTKEDFQNGDLVDSYKRDPILAPTSTQNSRLDSVGEVSSSISIERCVSYDSWSWNLLEFVIPSYPYQSPVSRSKRVSPLRPIIDKICSTPRVFVSFDTQQQDSRVVGTIMTHLVGRFPVQTSMKRSKRVCISPPKLFCPLPDMWSSAFYHI